MHIIFFYYLLSIMEAASESISMLNTKNGNIKNGFKTKLQRLAILIPAQLFYGRKYCAIYQHNIHATNIHVVVKYFK